MRGKAKSVTDEDLSYGITPAYAGKSIFNFCIMFRHKDHPRLCGEKERNPSEYVLLLGSPPPMRGKGHSRIHMVPAGGITPAYAGKSFS